MIEDCEVVVLGGGLGGLAVGSTLGKRAVVLEREERPGGLVQTPCFDGYWFDRVIHLLYFADPPTETRVREIVGDDLKPCRPLVYSETSAGVARFPLQNHLYGLDPQVVTQCLHDFAEVTFKDDTSKAPADFEESLLRTFGRGLCELFMFPYNEKVWKRPLSELAPSGFQWNVSRPSLAKILEGALVPAKETVAHCANGWYPRPPSGSPVRGMEVVSQALAAVTPGLRLRHSVTSVDLEKRLVDYVDPDGAPGRLRYDHLCSTLPLPAFVKMCTAVPDWLSTASSGLMRNRVLSVAISLKGPRPEGTGHWRYHADRDIAFTRLIYMHEFDPEMAPSDGWNILAEIIEPAEWPLQSEASIVDRVVTDAYKVGAIRPEHEVVGRHLMVIDPAYVVFNRHSQDAVPRAREFFAGQGVEMLGRYGRWEYSSMAQVMRDGFAWAESVSGE